MGNLAVGRHMAETAALATGSQYTRPGNAVEARVEEVGQEYPQRAKKPGRELGTPGGAEGPMTKKVKPFGSGVLWGREASTSNAPGRRGATWLIGDRPFSCLADAGTSPSMDPGQLTAQLGNSTRRSSSNTMITTSARASD